MTGAYCWRHIPAEMLDMVKKITPALRENHDAMKRIYEAGHAPHFEPKKYNKDDRRRMRANFWDYSEQELKDAGAWDQPARPKSEYGGRTVAQVMEEDDEDEEDDDEDDEDEEAI